jgi:hypothetical protein
LARLVQLRRTGTFECDGRTDMQAARTRLDTTSRLALLPDPPSAAAAATGPSGRDPGDARILPFPEQQRRVSQTAATTAPLNVTFHWG